MKFKKEDLQDKLINNVDPFEIVSEEDVPSGHSSERMMLYIFRYEGKLYEFGIPMSEGEGYHWYYADGEQECDEVEAYEETVTKYRTKK